MFNSDLDDYDYEQVSSYFSIVVLTNSIKLHAIKVDKRNFCKVYYNART